MDTNRHESLNAEIRLANAKEGTRESRECTRKNSRSKKVIGVNSRDSRADLLSFLLVFICVYSWLESLNERYRKT